MAHNAQTFTSPRSSEVMQIISDTLVERGMATPSELAKVVGMTPLTVGSYLVHMAKLGKVHCAVASEKGRGGSLPAKWAAGPAGPDVALKQSISARRVIVRKEWELNMKRDPLHCLFFGVPAAMMGATPC